MNSSLRSREPDHGENCLCGSKMPYRNCCMVDFSVTGMDKGHDAFNQGRYQDALYHCRRHLTWYRLAYRAHTIPFLKTGAPEAREMLRIDIEALSGIAEFLCNCYFECGIGEQIPELLDELKTAISDPRWTWKTKFHRGSWYLNFKKDRFSARKELAGIDLKKTSDPEVLSLYLDLFSAELGLELKLDICSRIVVKTRKPAWKLQYACARGTFLILAGESKRGTEEMESAISVYDGLPDEKKTFYGDSQCAHAVSTLSVLTRNQERAKEAAQRFGRILDHAEQEKWGGKIVAELLQDKAYALFRSRDYESSITHFKRSLALDPSNLTKVFYSQVLAAHSLLDEAREILGGVAWGDLNPSGRFDYGISAAELAFKSKDKGDITTAVKALLDSGDNGLYFNSIRSSVIADLKSVVVVSDESFIIRALRRLSQYAELKPNFMGIGLNLNKIIEDSVDSSKKKRRKVK